MHGELSDEQLATIFLARAMTAPPGAVMEYLTQSDIPPGSLNRIYELAGQAASSRGDGTMNALLARLADVAQARAITSALPRAAERLAGRLRNSDSPTVVTQAGDESAATSVERETASEKAHGLLRLSHKDPLAARNRATEILMDHGENRIEVKLTALRFLNSLQPKDLPRAQLVAMLMDVLNNGCHWYVKREAALMVPGLKKSLNGAQSAVRGSLLKLWYSPNPSLHLAGDWVLREIGAETPEVFHPAEPTDPVEATHDSAMELTIPWFRAFSPQWKADEDPSRNDESANAKDVPPTTFESVAGIDEVTHELRVIVDFLRKPQQYQRLGAKISDGVLLVGPPGVGKTLLARAVAGEAGVPFYNLSASEFARKWVGDGSRLVDRVFDEAEKNPAAIIFIDEVDSLGRACGSGQNVDEETTLAAILHRMDGFKPNTGVIVMAATNRPDILDSAFARRFSKIAVSPADLLGREAQLVARAADPTYFIPLGPDVRLQHIAKHTTGLSGAQLAKVLNNAAISAAGAVAISVAMSDVMSGFVKLLLGPNKSSPLSDELRHDYANHEMGHALALFFTTGDLPTNTTIIGHGDSGGTVIYTGSDEQAAIQRRSHLMNRLQYILGGVAAERILYGPDEISTGAHSDLRVANEIAKAMVLRYGMGKRIGLRTFSGNPNEGFGAYVSNETKQAIDTDIREIIDTAIAQIVKRLTHQKAIFDACVAELALRETMTDDELRAFIKSLPKFATRKPAAKKARAH